MEPNTTGILAMCLENRCHTQRVGLVVGAEMANATYIRVQLKCCNVLCRSTHVENPSYKPNLNEPKKDIF